MHSTSTNSVGHHGGHPAHSPNLQVLLGMGFRYDSCLEAQRIFDDDLDNMICYLLDGTHMMAGAQKCGASISDNRDKGKHVASWEDDP